jgi:glc operon protein GlcG
LRYAVAHQNNKEQTMRRLVQVLSISIVIVLTVAVLSAAAQAPQGRGGGQGGATAAAPARPVGVDAATAKKMMAAVEAAATAASAPVAIAIVDGNGDLVYFQRMDGASARAVTSSQGKARAALLLGVPTKEAQDAIAAGKPLPVTLTAPPAGAWDITIGQGGLPILKDGKAVAAIGCGGSTPANDEKFCQAGIDAMKK